MRSKYNMEYSGIFKPGVDSDGQEEACRRVPNYALQIGSAAMAVVNPAAKHIQLAVADAHLFGYFPAIKNYNCITKLSVA